jgi:hypothetical protein
MNFFQNKRYHDRHDYKQYFNQDLVVQISYYY